MVSKRTEIWEWKQGDQKHLHADLETAHHKVESRLKHNRLYPK